MTDEIARLADDEVELVSDGEGLSVLGTATAVERFLLAEGLERSATSLPGPGGVLAVGASGAQAASTIAENSGRWVKLTEESAGLVKKYGLRDSKGTGLPTGVVKGESGRIKGFVQFAKTPGASLRNPAALAGLAGVMAQLAMKQSMDEIAGYLERIEDKVDDVLRAHRDAVVADLVGVELAVEEAYALSARVGRVSDVTWSKIDDAPMAIGRTQAYVLRQVRGLSTKLQDASRVGSLADAATATAAELHEWLSVLARTVQLQERVGVLELARVLEDSPEDHDQHRIALQRSRQERREAIGQVTRALAQQLDAAAERANHRVLRHPSKSPEVVAARNAAITSIGEFHAALSLGQEVEALAARRWGQAFNQVRGRAVEATGERAKALGQGASSRARAIPRPRRRPGRETSD
jgi:hypothetical protein